MYATRRNLLSLACAAAVCAALPVTVATANDTGLRLVMFEQAGCAWCARWNSEVGPGYPKSTEGHTAPLQRRDIHAEVPADMHLVRRPQFTPTFVVLKDGTEVGRIEGYPGADFFWGLLDGILAKATPAAAAPKS